MPNPLLLMVVATVFAVAAEAAPPSPPPPLRAECDTGWARVLAPSLATAPVDARAVWLTRGHLRWPAVKVQQAGDRFRLYHAAGAGLVATSGQRVRGADGALDLDLDLNLEAGSAPLPVTAAERFKWVASGSLLSLHRADLRRLPALLRGQTVLVLEDAQGQVRDATTTQIAGALDDLYAAAAHVPDLGATPQPEATTFRLWAPTAQRVALCLHNGGSVPAHRLVPLVRSAATGIWSARLPGNLSGQTYTYLVDVFVPGSGLVRNRVTDPYSLSLNTDSQRSWIGRLDAPALQPAGWAQTPRPDRVRAATDLVVYELHLRDFSAADASVPAEHRGKYLAFTDTGSAGMRHLQALSAAGVTDVHLLPVFDFASVPERGCTTPDVARLVAGAPDGEQQQALVMAGAAGDCYNWGYDPWHYAAPEGSYASDATDGAVRVFEFRRMVQALHRAGLRVGMDMVFNHTFAAGQDPKSVLDRTVPGYYQRLDATGRIERSTCCDGTATENTMMARLMIDAAVVWVRHYRIDSIRFDLMGHQPRAAMLRLQAAVDAAAGRHIHLLGEGWNFGPVADGARFVQAAQGRLSGTGIATFSDRARDAVRGGGCCDGGDALLTRQGWITGLAYDPNGRGPTPPRDELLRAADLVRAGLAGTLRDYRLTTRDGSVKTLGEIDYGGQGAGYASQPDEVVNYIENHDNATLFDTGVLKLPPHTSREERARVQLLGLAVTAFSQGIAYFHAGSEVLRSKSLERNSYDSGDWFNRLDWTYTDNGYGSGLPPAKDNATLWPALQPLLASATVKPAPADIRFTRDAFFDLLRIRASSTLFRLRTAADVQARLRFLDTGPSQRGTLVAGWLDGRDLAGAGFSELVYAINVGKEAARIDLPALRGHALALHPAHLAPGAADPRPALLAQWDAAAGVLTVPARTALVYVGTANVGP